MADFCMLIKNYLTNYDTKNKFYNHVMYKQLGEIL